MQYLCHLVAEFLNLMVVKNFELSRKSNYTSMNYEMPAVTSLNMFKQPGTVILILSVCVLFFSLVNYTCQILVLQRHVA